MCRHGKETIHGYATWINSRVQSPAYILVLCKSVVSWPPTCSFETFEAFLNPITNFPSGSIRLNVTAKGKNIYSF